MSESPNNHSVIESMCRIFGNASGGVILKMDQKPLDKENLVIGLIALVLLIVCIVYWLNQNPATWR